MSHFRSCGIFLAAMLMNLGFMPDGKCQQASGAAEGVGGITFINGSLMFPPGANDYNRAIILTQTVPGVTQLESYLIWKDLEPQKDVWNVKALDESLQLCEEHHLGMLVLPWIMTAPAWFKSTPGYAELTDMQTGARADSLSPWAPATLIAYDHFYQALASRYKNRISIIKLGCAGSTFGEVGLSISDHPYACGDPYARADFQKRMIEKYGGMDRLNRAWGTSLASESAITFPDPEHHTAERVRWVDFISWMQESEVRNMVSFLKIIRRYFPSVPLDIPLGFGSDLARDGCDRTAICRAAADFKPVAIRSTHGSFNRNPPPLAYWFYKRMAPVCHSLGIGFGTEPPGGDLTHNELLRQYFEDASAGVSFVYHYYQNYHQAPDVIGEYKRVLRPGEFSQVDIGVLYPSTQMIVDMTFFPDGQREFCDMGRKYFDYDLVDENMIDWGMLRGYKVLVQTGGKVFKESTLLAMTDWLKAGGILITDGPPLWEALDGRREIAAGWLLDEDKSAAVPGAHVYCIGRGRLYSIDARGMTDYVPKVNGVLAHCANGPLHGYHGKDDGTCVTDFPSGRLVFNTKTLGTEFLAR
jgi:hypothetical protein